MIEARAQERSAASPASPALSPELAPLLAQWAGRHGLPLATAAALARRAIDGDPEALLAFGTDAALAYATTRDPVEFVRVALASEPAARADTDAEPREPQAQDLPAPKRWAGLRRALRVTEQVVFAVVLVLAVLVAYGTFIDNRWYKIVVIQGSSMEPTLSAGDAIVLTPPPDEIEPGMILTLEVDGKVVTHRVTEVRPDGTFVTKGDANEAADDFSGHHVRVVGEYRMRLPRLGRLLATTPPRPLLLLQP